MKRAGQGVSCRHAEHLEDFKSESNPGNVVLQQNCSAGAWTVNGGRQESWQSAGLA